MKSICTLAVSGMDLDCPNCGVTVKSGHGHTCSVDGKQVDRRTYPLKGSSKSETGTGRLLGGRSRSRLEEKKT